MSDLVTGFGEGWVVNPDTNERKATTLLSGDCAQLIQQCFGERLRFNTLSKVPEIDGQDLPNIFDFLHVVLSQKGWKISKDNCRDALLFIAQANQFDPIIDELERVKNDPKIKPIDINNFATYYLNNSDPLDNGMWRCFFIGACARAYRRGCKNDSMLILRSDKHGQKKSDLLRTLVFDEKYFCDTPINPKNLKDAYLKIGCHWVLEIAEVESFTSKTDAGALKALLSSRTDTFRPPYGEHIKKFPRPSLLVGTANEQVIIRDQTGSRRFHVTEINEKIKIDLVEMDRDNIWKAAILAYEAGQPWWLTDEEEEQLQIRNNVYQAENQYLSQIRHWLTYAPSAEFETRDVFENIKENPNQWDTTEAGKALKLLGYVQKQKRIGKEVRKRVWVQADTSVTSKNEKLVTPQNKAGERDSPEASQVTSNNQKGERNIERDTHPPRCESKKKACDGVTSPQTLCANERFESLLTDRKAWVTLGHEKQKEIFDAALQESREEYFEERKCKRDFLLFRQAKIGVEKEVL